jgi:DNA-directed RNA polymerase subunit RPC12/RpoP
MTHQSPTAEPEDEDRGKAVLFCPHCQYRGQWTDWCPGNGTHALRCPSCGTTVG